MELNHPSHSTTDLQSAPLPLTVYPSIYATLSLMAAAHLLPDALGRLFALCLEQGWIRTNDTISSSQTELLAHKSPVKVLMAPTAY